MQRRTPPPNGIHAYDSAPAVEEPLGPELLGRLVQVRTRVEHRDRRQHERPRGQLPAGHLRVARELACHVHDHRPHAQRLLHHRIHVVVVVERLGEALEHARRAQQALERPRQPGGGGLVARGEQRHQLVAQLHVGHRRAVLVSRREQQRENVVALLAVVRGTPVGDLRVDQLVDGGQRLAESRRRGEPAEVALEERHPVQDARQLAERRDALAEEVHALVVAHAEDRAQDHLERDRLHARAQLDLLAERPARHLALGGLGHHLHVAAHALAVEGREQQLALAHVALLVEREQRVLAERVAERERVGLAGVEDRGVAGEDALHLGRVGHVDHAPEDREARGEDVPVAAPAPDHPAIRRGRHERGLHQARHPGAGWEAHPKVVRYAARNFRMAACVSRGRST